MPNGFTGRLFVRPPNYPDTSDSSSGSEEELVSSSDDERDESDIGEPTYEGGIQGPPGSGALDAVGGNSTVNASPILEVRDKIGPSAKSIDWVRADRVARAQENNEDSTDSESDYDHVRTSTTRSHQQRFLRPDITRSGIASSATTPRRVVRLRNLLLMGLQSALGVSLPTTRGANNQDGLVEEISAHGRVTSREVAPNHSPAGTTRLYPNVEEPWSGLLKAMTELPAALKACKSAGPMDEGYVACLELLRYLITSFQAFTNDKSYTRSLSRTEAKACLACTRSRTLNDLSPPLRLTSNSSLADNGDSTGPIPKPRGSIFDHLIQTTPRVILLRVAQASLSLPSTPPGDAAGEYDASITLDLSKLGLDNTGEALADLQWQEVARLVGLNLDSVRRLLLKSNQLRRLDFPLDQFPSLRYVDVSRQPIESIPLRWLRPSPSKRGGKDGVMSPCGPTSGKLWRTDLILRAHKTSAVADPTVKVLETRTPTPQTMPSHISFPSSQEPNLRSLVEISARVILRTLATDPLAADAGILSTNQSHCNAHKGPSRASLVPSYIKESLAPHLASWLDRGYTCDLCDQISLPSYPLESSSSRKSNDIGALHDTEGGVLGQVRFAYSCGARALPETSGDLSRAYGVQVRDHEAIWMEGRACETCSGKLRVRRGR